MGRRRRTQVGIVGAGPAGLVLANVLTAAGIDCVVVEHRSRDHVETRARAGFLEQRTVDCLHHHGLAERLKAEALRHVRCEFRRTERRFSVPYGDLAKGRAHWVYPQQFLVRDLIDILLAGSAEVLFSSAVEAIEDVQSDTPVVVCRANDSGSVIEVACDVVAGCDGFRGVSRLAIPPGSARTFEKRYHFDWLAVLAEAAPATDQVVYASHIDGFAGQMPRTPEISRFYLQCAAGETTSDWPDERIWKELQHRLATDDAPELATGRVLEKGILTMRSAVTTPMQFARLFLAGDAAHVLTPSGAKGMNLAIADAAVLAEALITHFAGEDDGLLDGYTAARLPDVWQAQEFSDWLLQLIHGPPADSEDRAYQEQLRLARLDQLERSPAFAESFAYRYVG
jgi:p-hydroxybenzoate 3-monooxygenase